MSFHWVQDRVHQNQFFLYWAPGNINLADYFRKHHTAHHHKKMRQQYLVNTGTTNPNISCRGVYLRKISTKISGVKCVYKITANTISLKNLLKSTFSLNLIFTEFIVVTVLLSLPCTGSNITILYVEIGSSFQ